MPKKQAVLIGAGGVGSVVALAMEMSGHLDVTLVARSTYDSVTKNGFYFDSVDYGQVSSWKPYRIVSSVQDAAKYCPYDYIVVCTKNIPEVQTTEDLIRPLVSPECAIVVIQNGVYNELSVMKAYPDSYVIGGMSLIAAINHGGYIKHVGSDHITVGTLDKRPEAIERTKQFVDIYNQSKSEAVFTENISARRWWKLLYNATYNPAAAIMGIDAGRIHFSGLGKTLIEPAMYEVLKIAEVELGEKFPPDTIEKMLEHGNMGIYFEPSMLVDAKNGRVMELETLLGTPIRCAAKHQIEVPVLQVMYQFLRGRQFSLLEKNGKVILPSEPFSTSLEPIEF